MRVAITGHRPNKLGNDYNMTSPLITKIIEVLQGIIDEVKPTIMISGMALGIDTIWAILAHKNNIPLIAAIPCKNQDKMWPQQSKSLYNDLISHPLTTVKYVTEEEYSLSCMQIRNEWMVDNCDLLIAVWDGTSGGTGNCVRYLQSLGKEREIIIVNPSDYK